MALELQTVRTVVERSGPESGVYFRRDLAAYWQKFGDNFDAEAMHGTGEDDALRTFTSL